MHLQVATDAGQHEEEAFDLRQGPNGWFDAVLAALAQHGQQHHRRRDAVTLGAELQLAALQLAEHLREEGHEGGEAWPGRVLDVHEWAQDFVAFLIPLAARVQQGFQEGFLLFLRDN